MRLFKCVWTVIVAVVVATGGAGCATGGGADEEVEDEIKVVESPAARQGILSVDDAPVRGPGDARVTLYVFSDLQCPYCKKMHGTIERIAEEYPEEVRIVYKHYPLDIHEQAPAAARAAMAAQRQDAFWEMIDLIFAEQEKLENDGIFEKWARGLDLDVEQFEEDRNAISEERIEEDVRMGNRVGVRSVPTCFVNGHRIQGNQPFSKMKGVIDENLGRGER